MRYKCGSFLTVAVQFGYCLMYYFIISGNLKIFYSVASLLEIWYIWINISGHRLVTSSTHVRYQRNTVSFAKQTSEV